MTKYKNGAGFSPVWFCPRPPSPRRWGWVTPNHKLSVSPPLRLSAMHKWCLGQCHGAQAGTIVSPCIFDELGQLADWVGALAVPQRGLRGAIKWVQPPKPGQGGPWILLSIPSRKVSKVCSCLRFDRALKLWLFFLPWKLWVDIKWSRGREVLFREPLLN